MMKILFLVIVFFTTSFIVDAQKISIKDLKTGDLLFQNLDCGDMCDAIEAVTTGWQGNSFSHVGLVEIQNDTVYVWESAGPGVRRVLVDSFRQRSLHPLVLGRLQKQYQKLIFSAIQFIHNNNGVAYDGDFLYGNGKYYCSELIYDALMYANKNRPFFKLYPMTFKQPGSSSYFPVWVKYFEKLNMPIPEGKPGCNPGGLSRSDKIFIVGEF